MTGFEGGNRALVKQWFTAALAGPCPNRFSKRVNGEVVWCRCRKCLRCVNLRQAVLVGQMMAETASHLSSAVFTLTFDDKHYESLGVSEFRKDELLAFNRQLLKRVRYHWPEWSGRYFVTWEVGEQNGRVHAHLILFGLPVEYRKRRRVSVPWWTYGIVQADKMSSGAARYVSAYVADPEKKKLKLHSRGSNGLGYDYIRRFLETVALERAWPGAVYKFTGREFLQGPFFELDFKRYPLPLAMFEYAVSLGLDADWPVTEVGDLQERQLVELELENALPRLREYRAQKPLKQTYQENGFYHVLR